MKVFNTICIDNVTKGVMVLSDASYNDACFWLESKLGSPDYTETIIDYTFIIYGKTRFIYDEERGYLIREEA